ncbi:S-4TM family putative pore-forming effector [Nonomuraea typhae]|uniref:S-4TM family putative pore-forming effector n=1 Tax=Nonomuraea typhae TaxID=2603600 RepID=A0ABW7YSL2_9ACTN
MPLYRPGGSCSDRYSHYRERQPGPRPVPAGDSARITQRQDEPPEHLQLLLAYSHLYKTAQWWRRIRSAGSFALAAISAGWLVLGPNRPNWVGTSGHQQGSSRP